MNSREQKIVNKIISLGKNEASEIITNAENHAKELIVKAEKDQKDILAKDLKEIEIENNKRLEIEKTQRNLETSKAVLIEKRKIIDEIFDNVLVSLRNLKSKDYTEFLKGALSNAKMGDSLIVSKNVGEKAKIEKLAIFSKKKLSIAKTSSEFSGGVIIFNDDYELVFTFESLVKEKKEKSISDIAKKIF
jgi:V/A-type H+/Na+-transporting ATPase subunit E